MLPLIRSYAFMENFVRVTDRGATTAEKLRETKVWVPTPGHLRPAPGELGVGAERGRPLPPVRVQGYHPRKFFENSGA